MTQWASANRILVPIGSPNACPNLFASTVGPQGYPAGVWHTVDLANGPLWPSPPNVPESAVAVDVRGLAILSNASPILCDIQVTFRVPGTTFVTGNYQIQAFAQPGDGERANAAVIVPVVDRKFQFYWWVADQCQAPPSGMGLNLFVQAIYCNEGNTPDPPDPPDIPWSAEASVVVGGNRYAGPLPLVTP